MVLILYTSSDQPLNLYQVLMWTQCTKGNDSIIKGRVMARIFVSTRTRFSLRDKRLFEIIGIEITRVDCTSSFFDCQERVSRCVCAFVVMRVSLYKCVFVHA